MTASNRNRNLAPCPDSPNCVSSQSSGKRHRVDPIMFQGAPEAAFAKLRRIIQSMKRTEIVEETATYLHAECKSALFGFVDDVEFLLDEKNKVIHVRSAARTGYWDLGVNRKRIERIREAFDEKRNSGPSD